MRRHWDTVSLTVPKTHLYAHGATRGPPDCKSSTTEPELWGALAAALCQVTCYGTTAQAAWSFRKLLFSVLSHPYNLLKEEKLITYIRRKHRDLIIRHLAL